MNHTCWQVVRIAAAAALLLAAAGLRGEQARAQEPPLVRVVQVACPGVMTDTGPQADKVLAMVRRGLLETTGQDTVAEAWGRFVRPEDIVGLKIDTRSAPQLATHREVVEALAQTLQEAGIPAENIVVWDGQQADLGRAGWTLADEPGQLRVLASDVEGYDEVAYFDCEPASAEGERRSRFSKILTKRITKLVNVPVLAYQPGAGVSMALENLVFGCCDNTSRGQVNQAAEFLTIGFAQPAVQKRLTLVIADALRPRYDGSPGGEAAGEWNCDSLIFALGQPSADAVGVAIIDEKRREKGLAPLAETEDRPDFLTEIAGRGLGITDLAKIKWDKVTL
jgi:hypothetical protein